MHSDLEARAEANILAFPLVAPRQESGFDVVWAILVDLAGVPTCVRPRRHLVGVRGASVFHVQNSTGTQIVHSKEAERTLQVVVLARDAECTEGAVGMVEDLVACVLAERGVG